MGNKKAPAGTASRSTEFLRENINKNRHKTIEGPRGPGWAHKTIGGQDNRGPKGPGLGT